MQSTNADVPQFKQISNFDISRDQSLLFRHRVPQPAARKWRENEEIKRKWREYEETERKWRESEEMERGTE